MQQFLKFALCFLILVVSSACLKTAEQIKREQKVDSLSQELSQSHKTVADLMLQVKELQGKLNSMNGQFEELGHQQATAQGKQFDDLRKQVALITEQVNSLQTENKALNEKVTALQGTVEAQKGFIEKATQTLGKISAEKVEKTKPDSGNDYDSAMSLIKNKKSKQAKEILLSLSDDKSQSASVINKANYQLGLIEFKSKRYDDALVFFSKVYTQYPESSIAPSALFHIGKAFKAMKKIEEANSSFSELLEKYPNAKEVTLAKKELK